MMGTWMPGTCREDKKINKYIEENCAPSWIYLRNYTGMHGQQNIKNGTECSETSAHKIQTPGNHPKERIRQLEHGESLKSRILIIVVWKQ